MGKLFIWIVIILAVLGGGWYYMNNKQAAPATQEQAQNTVVQQPLEDGAEGVVIGDNLALGTDGNATLGTYLIGYTGKPVYTKDGDTATTSSCYDTCATNWPPYIVGAEDNVAQVKSGVDGTKTGTIIRTDGSIQMTYNSKPIYFYAVDVSGSDAKGDGVNAVWHVAKP